MEQMNETYEAINSLAIVQDLANCHDDDMTIAELRKELYALLGTQQFEHMDEQKLN